MLVSTIGKLAKSKWYAASIKGTYHLHHGQWNEFKDKVTGVGYVKYKGFTTEADAQQWLSEQGYQSEKGYNSGKPENEKSGDEIEEESIASSSNSSQTSSTKSSKSKSPLDVVLPDLTHFDYNFIIYTDGSHIKNKHVSLAGWAYVIVNRGSIIFEQASGSLYGDDRTNNRAELTAILEATKSSLIDRFGGSVLILTDSEYSMNCVTKFIKNWKRNGWKTATGGDVKNADLIRAISDQIDKYDCHFQHVRAHNGDHFNEIVDGMAKDAAQNS